MPCMLYTCTFKFFVYSLDVVRADSTETSGTNIDDGPDMLLPCSQSRRKTSQLAGERQHDEGVQ
jgi:hypothetical protein